MKLAVSNIGWDAEDDKEVYKFMKKAGFTGLEIAPTRIFQETPYDKMEQAQRWSDELESEYGFVIPSMQSIWFGRQEKLFGSDEERATLVQYTKKAIDFAATIHCHNLVFGCPRNRVIPEGADPEIGVRFFREIGDYALKKGTVIGMEANPPIYNTNYINDTVSALQLISEVDSKGFMLNLDVGTMIQNEEDVFELKGKVHLINHVHISEPGLKPIEDRQLHKELKSLLDEENYQGFVSIEMGKIEDMSLIEKKLNYVSDLFND